MTEQAAIYAGARVPRGNRDALAKCIDNSSVDELKEYARHAALIADLHEDGIAQLREHVAALFKTIEISAKALNAAEMAVLTDAARMEFVKCARDGLNAQVRIGLPKVVQ